MKLIVHLDLTKATELKTKKTSASVGRAPQSDLVIAHESVSRQHCQIELKAGVLYITDVGSSNGTFVNGKRIAPQEKVRLENNQQIRIGRLECEVSNGSIQEAESATQESATSTRGNKTETTQFPRPELTNSKIIPAKPRRPRNPVTDDDHHGEVEVVESKRTYIILFILVVSILIFLMAPIYL